MFRNLFANVRAKSPLVHNITNYVTVNDCANIVLACGASPIMADDAAEVEDITSLCAGLNLNIGTLNSRTIPSMLLAGHTANRLGRPVVLDPVGAGASHLRTETALRLLREVKFTVIRGNISEIRTLAAGSGTTKGVDADTADKVTDETLDKTVAFAKAFAARTGAVVAVTGAIDIVADGERAFCIRNGHPMMSAVTGTGCQLSALTAPSERRCCGCLRHGPCGRSRSQPPVQAGRQRHLPQLHHRRDLQHDPRTARGRSTL